MVKKELEQGRAQGMSNWTLQGVKGCFESGRLHLPTHKHKYGSCGCSACCSRHGYDNAVLCRGVRYCWARQNWSKAELRGCLGGQWVLRGGRSHVPPTSTCVEGMDAVCSACCSRHGYDNAVVCWDVRYCWARKNWSKQSSEGA